MTKTEPNGDERPAHEDPPYIDLTVGPDRTVDNRRFGQLLADWRQAAGLSRTAAAGALGVSAEYLRLIELGRRTPAMGQMRAFLDVYQIDGALGLLQPGGDRPDLIVLPPGADEPLTIDFKSRIREARKRRLSGSAARDDDGDETTQGLLTTSRAAGLGYIVTLLVRADDATLGEVQEFLEAAIGTASMS